VKAYPWRKAAGENGAQKRRSEEKYPWRQRRRRIIGGGALRFERRRRRIWRNGNAENESRGISGMAACRGVTKQL
jgi:hypothetical protein